MATLPDPPAVPSYDSIAIAAPALPSTHSYPRPAAPAPIALPSGTVVIPPPTVWEPVIMSSGQGTPAAMSPPAPPAGQPNATTSRVEGS